MSVKDTIKDAGQGVADAAKKAGHVVAEKAGQAADWVREKTGMSPREGSDRGVGAIQEKMDVVGSCGNKLGVVDHVEGGAIKLTRQDSPDGQHHFIPLAWVDHVDSHVHLNKNCGEAKQQWNVSPATAG